MSTLIDKSQVGLLRLRGYRSLRVARAHGGLHVLAAHGRGDLPPVLLLHGLSSCAADFAPLFWYLRPRVRRVLALDVPGHGLSPPLPGSMHPLRVAAATFDALDELIDEPMILVGNSMGGLGALRYSLARPERVAGLVLISPGGAPMEEGELRALFTPFVTAEHRDVADFMGRVLARPRPWTLPVLAWGARQRMTRPAIRQMVAGFDPVDFLRADEVAALRVRTLFIWGEHERLLPEHNLDFFQRALPPCARLLRPPGLGHAPHIEDPRRVAELVLEFAGGDA